MNTEGLRLIQKVKSESERRLNVVAVESVGGFCKSRRGSE